MISWVCSKCALDCILVVEKVDDYDDLHRPKHCPWGMDVSASWKRKGRKN